MAMNKRAMMGREPLYLLAAIFIFVLLMLFFLLSLTFHPKASESDIQKLSGQNIVSSTAFLNTRVEVDGQNITMADLARLARINPTYQTVLKDNAKALISPIFGPNVILSIYSKGFYLDVLSSDYIILEQVYLYLPFPQDPDFGIRFGVVKSD